MTMARRRLHPLIYAVGLFGLVFVAHMLTGKLREIHSNNNIFQRDFDSPECRPFCSGSSEGAQGIFAVDLQNQDIEYQRSLGEVTILKDEDEDWEEEGEDIGPRSASEMLKLVVHRLDEEESYKEVMKTTPVPVIDEDSVMKAEVCVGWPLCNACFFPMFCEYIRLTAADGN